MLFHNTFVVKVERDILGFFKTFRRTQVKTVPTMWVEI